MAADVTSLIRILGGYKDDAAVGSEASTVLITRDLLGGGGGGGGGVPSKLDSQELDLDMKVPDGWEKRLDLKVSLFVFGRIVVSFIFSGKFLGFLFLFFFFFFFW